MGKIGNDPFFATFEFFERGPVLSWWRCAELWRDRRGAPAITSLDLLLAALEHEAWEHKCRWYFGPRVSIEAVLCVYESLHEASKADAASETVRGPLGLQVSGELNRIIERYNALRVTHDEHEYVMTPWLFFYALITCEGTLLARVSEALGVDRYAAKLIVRDQLFPSECSTEILSRVDTLFPWDRPYVDYICPPELRNLSVEQWLARVEAWRLHYVKDQIQRHFLPIPPSQPVPGMIICFMDGEFEDVVVYDGSDRQWWSLLHEEPRLLCSYAGARMIYYLRKQVLQSDP